MFLSFIFIFFIIALWESTELRDKSFKFPYNVDCLLFDTSRGFRWSYRSGLFVRYSLRC